MFHRVVAATNSRVSLELPHSEAESAGTNALVANTDDRHEDATHAMPFRGWDLAGSLRTMRRRAEMVAGIALNAASRGFWAFVMLGSEQVPSVVAEHTVTVTADRLDTAEAIPRAIPVLTGAERAELQAPRIDIPAAMSAFRTHVAAVKAARANGTSAVIAPERHAADVRIEYDAKYEDVVSALIAERTRSRHAQLACVALGDWAQLDELRSIMRAGGAEL